jgi:hypothetical protein
MNRLLFAMTRVNPIFVDNSGAPPLIQRCGQRATAARPALPVTAVDSFKRDGGPAVANCGGSGTRTWRRAACRQDGEDV